MWRGRRAAWRVAAGAGLAILLAACASDEPLGPPEGRLGTLRADRIVAIGDDLLAGATDGAVFRPAQELSVPALFARAIGRDEPLEQPLVGEPGLAILAEGGRLTLEALQPLELGRLEAGTPLRSDLPRPFDNLAVPGGLLTEFRVARSRETSVFGNPFYDLVLRDRAPVLDQVRELDPTLVLVGYGTADALVFALSGGDPELAPGLPTPPATFARLYGELLDALLAVTDQVVVFTVPDPSRMPFLDAVRPVVFDFETDEPVRVITNVPVLDPETGEQLLDDEGNPVFRQEQVTVPLIGPDGDLGEGDRVTLDALPLVRQGIGVPREFLEGTGDPLPDRVVLDAAESAAVSGAVNAYNEAIRAHARARNLAVVDVHAFQLELETNGVVTDAVRLDGSYPGGQGFGLDGARFTPKAYGAITNRLIDVINTRFDARIPAIRTAQLPGVPILDIRADAGP